MSEEKETNINGVDVNDCDLYCSRGYCMDDNISPVDCKDRPDCEYKQLKRLQEENEKLKEKNKELLNLCNNGGALLATESAKTKKYKQALENIKQFLIFAGHSNTGNKYFENVEKALNIANEVLNDRN